MDFHSLSLSLHHTEIAAAGYALGIEACVKEEVAAAAACVVSIVEALPGGHRVTAKRTRTTTKERGRSTTSKRLDVRQDAVLRSTTACGEWLRRRRLAALSPQ